VTRPEGIHLGRLHIQDADSTSLYLQRNSQFRTHGVSHGCFLNVARIPSDIGHVKGLSMIGNPACDAFFTHPYESPVRPGNEVQKTESRMGNQPPAVFTE